MQCRATLRNKQRCRNKSIDRGYCYIHAQMFYGCDKTQFRPQDKNTIGRIRSKKAIEKEVPYYDYIKVKGE